MAGWDLSGSRGWLVGYAGIGALIVTGGAVTVLRASGPIWYALVVLPLLFAAVVLIGRFASEAPEIMARTARWAARAPSVAASLVFVPLAIGALGSVVVWQIRVSARERCHGALEGARSKLDDLNEERAREFIDAAKTSCSPDDAPEIEKLSARRQRLITDANAEAAAENERLRALLNDRSARARNVWAAYDRLPAREQNKGKLIAAIAEARTHEQNTYPEFAEAVRRLNDSEFRKRMAPLVTPATRARGEHFEVLVPSAERAACLVMGSQWSQDVESLRTLGYQRIHCDASLYKSRLTGEMIEDPARDWDVQ